MVGDKATLITINTIDLYELIAFGKSYEIQQF